MIINISPVSMLSPIPNRAKWDSMLCLFELDLEERGNETTCLCEACLEVELMQLIENCDPFQFQGVGGATVEELLRWKQVNDALAKGIDFDA